MLHALECLFEAQHKAVLVGTALGEPRTSFECSWIKPRKRKVPATSANDLHYTKHEYGKTRKRKPVDWIQGHLVNVAKTLLKQEDKS